jgi:hypothetical protein
MSKRFKLISVFLFLASLLLLQSLVLEAIEHVLIVQQQETVYYIQKLSPTQQLWHCAQLKCGVSDLDHPWFLEWLAYKQWNISILFGLAMGVGLLYAYRIRVTRSSY